MQTKLEQAVQEPPCSLLSARCFQRLVPYETVKKENMLVSWETKKSKEGSVMWFIFLSASYLIKQLWYAQKQSIQALHGDEWKTQK